MFSVSFFPSDQKLDNNNNDDDDDDVFISNESDFVHMTALRRRSQSLCVLRSSDSHDPMPSDNTSVCHLFHSSCILLVSNC